ncbi:MAG TPA: hypothetical protein VFY17_02925 [Pilimelia sp.]|nr:hypothetical protein [Pilimelia sp.]
MASMRTAPLRRIVTRVTIGTFSLAALLGILALLGGGDFDQTEVRILLTTLLVGVVNIAVLCYLATAGRPAQPVGVAGGVAVLVPLVTGMAMIWAGDAVAEGWWKTFGVGAIVAGTLAQACLLLVLPAARRSARAVRYGTLAMAAVLAVQTSALVLRQDIDGDLYYRLLGVVAVLDALGTVVLAALTKFGPDAGPDGTQPSDAAVRLPGALARDLDAFAAGHGRNRDEVVATAVTRYLTAAAGGHALPDPQAPEPAEGGGGRSGANPPPTDGHPGGA